MTLKINIETENAAYVSEGEGAAELLEQVIQRLKEGRACGVIKDHNGNVVGDYVYND